VITGRDGLKVVLAASKDINRQMPARKALLTFSFANWRRAWWYSL